MIHSYPITVKPDIPDEAYYNCIDDILAEGKDVEVRIKGASMRPYWRGGGGEKLIASPFKPDELQCGEIVIFRFGEKYLVHRIVQRIGDNITTRGDGVVKKRENITVDDVKGIVRAYIKPNGKVKSTQTLAAKIYCKLWLRLPPKIRGYILRLYGLIANR